MNLALTQKSFEDHVSPVGVAALIDALGSEEFEAEALQYLNHVGGVEHFTVYRVGDPKPELLGGASIRGPHASRGRRSQAKARLRSWGDLQAARAASGASAGPVLVHGDIEELDDRALRWAFDHFHIVDRVVLCGRRADDVYAISLLRSDAGGRFTDDELGRLSDVAPVVIAACATHAGVQWARNPSSVGFSSVEQIESKLRGSDWRLTERELQVCARILYGVSALGIALDLGLGEETIATYRKRLYLRLRIGGRHELFQKYLKLL